MNELNQLQSLRSYRSQGVRVQATESTVLVSMDCYRNQEGIALCVHRIRTYVDGPLLS